MLDSMLHSMAASFAAMRRGAPHRPLLRAPVPILWASPGDVRGG
jgi:hypothetical protein